MFCRKRSGCPPHNTHSGRFLQRAMAVRLCCLRPTVKPAVVCLRGVVTHLWGDCIV